MNKKTGFTLAEVLITLGIIGIVAAMTLPGLIYSYKVKQYEAQLKKTYVLVMNGFKKMMALETCTDIECLNLFNENGNNDPEYNDKIDEAVRKIFNVSITCKSGDERPECSGYEMAKLKGGTPIMDFTNSYKFYLQDGTLISIGNKGCSEVPHPEAVRHHKICGRIIVDLNGKKAPNTMGIDRFSFGNLFENGDLVPDSSLEYSKAFDSTTSYWRNGYSQCGKPGVKLKDDPTPTINGQNCMARILENNFELDYLH